MSYIKTIDRKISNCHRSKSSLRELQAQIGKNLGIVIDLEEDKLMRRALIEGLNQLDFQCNVKRKKSKTKQKFLVKAAQSIILCINPCVYGP